VSSLQLLPISKIVGGMMVSCFFFKDFFLGDMLFTDLLGELIEYTGELEAVRARELKSLEEKQFSFSN